MQFLDKFGWPLERIKGRCVLNFFRLIIHTRCVKFGKFHHEWPTTDKDGMNTVTEKRSV